MNRLITRTLALVSTLALLGTPAPSSAQSEGKRTLKEVYDAGVKHFEAGDYVTALKDFETFLKHQPNYPYARNYAAQCRQKIQQGIKPKRNLEAELATIVIPSVEFNNTDLGLVFEFLTQKSEELSGGKVVANFIYKGSEEQRKGTTITLKLRNAPFTDVVKYVGQLSRTAFTYEEFAIVGTPGNASPTPITDATPPSESAALESKFDSNGTGTLNPVPPANSDPFGNQR